MNIGTLTATLGIDDSGLDAAARRMERFRIETETSISNTRSSLNSLGKDFDKVGRNIYYFGTAATRFLTVPIIGAGVAIFAAGKDFETAMQKIVGLVGVSQKQVDIWKKQLLELGPALGKTPTELANALYYITSSGVSGSQALDVLTQSAKASSAGLGTSMDVANAVTSAMNAYSSSNLTATRTLDILTAAVRVGKAEGSDFAKQIGDVIPIASKMKISFDQVAAGMAAITLTGAPAAEAATQLKMLLSDILKIKPNTEAAKALQVMGLSASSLKNELANKGIISTLMTLDQLTKKYGTNLLQSVIPNIRAMQANLSLMGDRLGANISIFEQVYKSTGDANKAFEAMSNILQYKWNQVVAQAQVFAIEFLNTNKDKIVPMLQNLMQILAKAASWWLSLSSGMQSFILKALAFLAVIGPISVAVGLLSRLLSGFLFILPKIIEGMKILSISMQANPILAVGLAIATLTGYYATAFIPRTNDATEAQKKLNKELEKGKDLSDKKTDIGEQISVLNQLNRSQVESLKSRIEEQLRLEDSYGATLLAKQKVVDDAYMNTTSKTNEWIIDKNEDTSKKSAFAVAMENRLKVFEEGKSYEERIKLLNNYLKTVESKLKSMPKGVDSGSDKEFNLSKYEQIKKVMENVAGSEQYAILANKVFGDSFDVNTEKVNTYKSALEQLLRIGVSPTDNKIRMLSNKMFVAEASIDDTTKILKNMRSELSFVNQMAKTYGETYDDASVKLGIYKDTLEQLLKKEEEQKSKLKAAGIFALFIPNTNNIKTSIESINAEIQKMNNLVAQKSMQQLTADLAKTAYMNSLVADTFDRTQNKIIVLQQEIQKYTTIFESLYEIESKRQGRLVPILSPDMKNAISTIQSLNTQIYLLQNQTQMINEVGSAFTKMGNAIQGAAGSWLEWIGIVLGGLPDIIKMVEVLTATQMASVAATNTSTAANLANTASSIAQTSADSGAAIAGATKSGAKLPFPANLVAIAAGVAAVIVALSSIPKMAKGGIVPSGYGNDTYPALLSSGEMVVPPGKLDDLRGSDAGSGVVEFRIDGYDLVGLFRKHSNKLSKA